MRRQLAKTVTLLATCGIAHLGLAEEQPRLELTIDSPNDGAVVGDAGGMGFISGKAIAHYGEFQTFDIMFVIDQSDSTSNPSGADIDGDGKIGQRSGEDALWFIGKILPLPNTDSGDSVLAAELAAVETLIEQLDPRTTRVGIVGFSGDSDPLTPNANVFVPLTSQYTKVRRGLRELARIGPVGRTDMQAGIRVATVELMGSQSAFSEKRDGAKRIMMFLTDGKPTLPLESSNHQNRRLAIAAAAKAASLRIRIDTFAIGEEALSDAEVTVEMARVSEGVFTPVVDPKNLATIFEQVSFSEISELKIENKTTGQTADYPAKNADGTFSALIAMNEGANTLEVYARSTDGTEARRQVTVNFLENAPVQKLTRAQRAIRNRLMETRLADLKARAVSLETERDDSRREEVVRDMERAREEIQKRVEIETEARRAQEAAEDDE